MNKESQGSVYVATSNEINYPPEDLFRNHSGKSSNYESLILWMLNNNEQCSWANFSEKISTATLSHYLSTLLESGFIQRVKRSLYKITPAGRTRYAEITTDGDSKEKKLSIPPEVILRKRNYEHIILWACYNNTLCKWSDFRDKPLLINQSSLSKALRSLLNRGFINRIDRDYVITQRGKSEYSQMLHDYDLDRQALLEEETRRIEEITRLTKQFFEQNRINDSEVKYRFLSNALKLDYAKLQQLLTQEEFNKILLFLAINHPSNYPKSLSPSEFSRTYAIEQRILDYYLYEFLESKSNLFPTKFFKIEDERGNPYYFQANEKLEALLRVIVEDHVSKFTYLNKLYEHEKDKIQTPNFSSVISQIVQESCTSVFHPNFAQPLERFLPQYIEYLAYKIEAQKQITSPLDKLEGVAWLNIPEVFQSSRMLEGSDFISSRCDQGNFSYSLPLEFLNILPQLWISKIEVFKSKIFQQDNFSDTNLPLIQVIEKNLVKGDVSRASNTYSKNSNKLSSFEQLILKDLLFSVRGELEESLQRSAKLIESNPLNYTGYLFNGISLMESNNLIQALEMVERGLIKAPHILLSCLKIQLTSLLYGPEKAVKLTDEILLNNPNNMFLLQTKIILFLAETQKCHEALELIKNGMSLYPADSTFRILDLIALSKIKHFNEVLESSQNWFPSDRMINDNALYHSISFLRAYANISLGDPNSAIDIIELALEKFPHHSLPHWIKAILNSYDLIYEYLPERASKQDFFGEIEKTLEFEKVLPRKGWYYCYKSTILLELDETNAAMDAINEAITLCPKTYEFYKKKLKIYEFTNQLPEAFTLVEEMDRIFPDRQIDIKAIKAAIYLKMEQYDAALQISEEILNQNPHNIAALNAKAYALFYLGHQPEAFNCAQQLIATDPTNGNSYDSYGELLMVHGEYLLAIEQFKKALELDPYDFYAIDTHYKMAKCYAKLGEFKEAVKWLDKGKENVKVAVTCCSYTSRAWLVKLEKHKKQLSKHISLDNNKLQEIKSNEN